MLTVHYHESAHGAAPSGSGDQVVGVLGSPAPRGGPGFPKGIDRALATWTPLARNVNPAIGHAGGRLST